MHLQTLSNLSDSILGHSSHANLNIYWRKCTLHEKLHLKISFYRVKNEF